MSDLDPTAEMDCSTVRELIHERLDGRASPDDDGSLETHLGDCSECREVEDGLRLVRDAMRGLPRFELPDEALERVWASTVSSAAPRRATRRAWVAGLAAVVALFALGVGWALPTILDAMRENSTSMVGDAQPASDPSSTPAFTSAEIETATAQTRAVLGITGRALRRVEDATLNDVWSDTLASAVRKIRVRLPFVPTHQ